MMNRSWSGIATLTVASMSGPQRAASAVLLALASIELTILEIFLVPLKIDVVPVPVSLVLAVIGNIVLPSLMYRATGNRFGAAVPLLIWFVLVMVFAGQRPEGDVILPNSVSGVSFLLLGMVSAGVGLGWVLLKNVRDLGKSPKSSGETDNQS